MNDRFGIYFSSTADELADYVKLDVAVDTCEETSEVVRGGKHTVCYVCYYYKRLFYKADRKLENKACAGMSM